MSFDSEPGSDDGGLPPIDVVIPDDARELAGDVLAYHRELRAQRRRARLIRLLGWTGLPRHAAIFPLIATCAALALVAGAMLSVVTISPAMAPTLSASPQPTVTTLPRGQVRLDTGQVVATTSLDGSLVALVPPDCDCTATLKTLASQGRATSAVVYFVYYAADATSADIAQMDAITSRYGDGVARTVYDLSGVFFYAFTPQALTALLVDSNGGVRVVTAFPAGFDLTPRLRGLKDTH